LDKGQAIPEGGSLCYKREIIHELIERLGKENVITGREDMLCYSYDATPDVPDPLPDVVVTPVSTGQVSQVIQVAQRRKIPVYPRGSGTNLSGGAVPLKGGIVVSMLKMADILEIDAENLTATVQPGVIIQDLNNAVSPHGLLYPPRSRHSGHRHHGRQRCGMFRRLAGPKIRGDKALCNGTGSGSSRRAGGPFRGKNR
jgi:hypothetical protein